MGGHTSRGVLRALLMVVVVMAGLLVAAAPAHAAPTVTRISGPDRYGTARPGYSEHQTGLTIDLVACGASACSGIDSFGATAQGRWTAANAHRFGFIVRYESGQTYVTGYAPEPWHLRYVGVALASDYRAGGFRTLEQYFDTPAAPTYY